MIRTGVEVLDITRLRVHEVIQFQTRRGENCSRVVSIGRPRTTERLPWGQSDGAGENCEQ